jgi:hypothetical protein
MRKKMLMILSIIAVLALLVVSCAAEPEDAEMEDTGMDDSMADEELMVEEDTDSSEMEQDDDNTDSVGSDNDGDADDMGDAESGEMTDEEMIAFIEEKLAGNHDLERVLNAEKTYDEWVVTIDRMIDYGAAINDEEKELIIQWLLERQESMMDEGAMVEEAAVAMTDEEMIAFIEEKLAGNHDLDRVLNADKTYDEWVVTIDRMIDYGAAIDEEEKELIIQWLLNR